MADPPIAISLFSGMGGLDLGFLKAGYRILVQIDRDAWACDTLRKNFKSSEIWCEDICRLSGRDLLKRAGLRRSDVGILYAGPSCQPFSRSNEGRRRGTLDPRGRMIFEFARIVADLRPPVFLMENVRGLASSNAGMDLRRLLRRFRRAGYRTGYRILDAASYGLPQHRERMFIIGTSDHTEFDYPPPTHGKGDEGLKPYVTAGAALRDLDDGRDCDGAVSVGGRYGHLLNEIPPGMNYLYYTRRLGHARPLFEWRSKFWTFLLKLDPKKPSSTIQARPGPYVGPFHWRNRRLTIHEAKRLQGVPDEFVVSGYRDPVHGSPAWRQVGDAVPPPVAVVLARSLRRQIF